MELSLRWLPAVAAVAPAYLAVQDGMSEAEVVDALARGFSGIFIGGTLAWKIQTGAMWTALGRRLGLPVHIGRVGTAKRLAWAIRIGANSVDSCLPLWSRENLLRFRSALDTRQATLGW